MKATDPNKFINEKVYFPEPFKVEFEKETIDSCLADDEVLIKTKKSLISPGTELALYTGTHVGIKDSKNKFAKYPFFPGYAASGEVVAVGSNVEQLAKGQLVYMMGKHSLYNKLSISNIEDIPILEIESEDYLEKSLFTRLAAITMTSIVLSEIHVGDVVAVIGMGLIGNLVAQLYSLMGAEVIAVDLVRERLDIAESVGIDHTILSGRDIDLKDKIRELTGKDGADIVVEATGVPDLVPVALDAVKYLGQVIALGSTRGYVNINVYKDIHLKCIKFIGAQENIQSNPEFKHTRQSLSKYIIKLISRGILKTEPLITHRMNYRMAEQGYEMLLNKQNMSLGVILDWNDSL